MIVSCAGCGTKYRVSDDKIGSFGVKVRCPKCRTVFEVKQPEEAKTESLAEKLFGKEVVSGISSDAAPSPKSAPPTPKPSQPAAKPSQPAVKQPSEPARPVRGASAAPPTPAPWATQSEPRQGAEGRREEPGREPAGAAASSTDAADAQAGGGTPTFAFKTCEEDPRILARALVSDILFYNRDSRDKGLSEGKVLAYLGREIARSWDTYKERVGVEAAMETDFFRQAVNEILGEGRQIL